MFAKHAIAKFAGTALAAAALGFGAFGAAATASAGTADKQFLNDIEQAGITYDSQADAVHDAGVVCQELGNGTDKNVILRQYVQASDGLSTAQGKAFIVASVKAYCPQYLK